MNAPAYRPGMPPMPAQITRLPVHRGYPVPWFVAWVDGVPDFRIADGGKLFLAVTQRRCWVCGERLTSERFAFVIGPMCAVNRISSEPPSHVDCARFSAAACPFLARPHMERRESGKPDGLVDPAGTMLRRNPGVALVWITTSYEHVRDTKDGSLFRVGDPKRVLAIAEGRPATKDELRASIESGLPSLLEIAQQDGPRAIGQLRVQVEDAAELLGIELDGAA